MTPTYSEYAADVYEAICRLLEHPDPDDLPTRGHHLTQEGDPQRFRRYRDLPMRYAAHVRPTVYGVYEWSR